MDGEKSSRSRLIYCKELLRWRPLPIAYGSKFSSEKSNEVYSIPISRV